MFENGSFLRRRKRFKIPKQEKEALNAVLTKATTTLQSSNNTWCSNSTSGRTQSELVVNNYYRSPTKQQHYYTTSFNLDETIPFAVPANQQNQIASAIVLADYRIPTTTASSNERMIAGHVNCQVAAVKQVKKRTNFNIDSILAKTDDRR